MAASDVQLSYPFSDLALNDSPIALSSATSLSSLLILSLGLDVSMRLTTPAAATLKRHTQSVCEAYEIVLGTEMYYVDVYFKDESFVCLYD